ncbi:SSrecog-domain-containing protein [Trichodelitschia bisporula]|uniref:FACT complex subunit POB3 n=1 Tax=Trichodelitschia bisporula TaxID=703511 RepID=A0A6G1HUB3_9PEZI|nr:SSrecog-domain-containing protein [Trichodelitschia bisporula]
MSTLTETFDNTHLDLSKDVGRCRFAGSGLGWKPSGGGDVFQIDKDEMLQAQWSRAARGYEIKIFTRTKGLLQIDGFQEEDHERVMKVFKQWYGVAFENREHSLRGWNWGKAEFTKAELSFNVQSRPAFEIPYSEVLNANIAGKNEIAVEFRLPEGKGKTTGPRPAGEKLGAARDQLVEMRLFIPGMASKSNGKADDDDQEADEEQEEQNAASLFYDTILEKADIGDVAGDTYATFLDILHLTPRGRFDLDMYAKSFRMRGKTYDYKVEYDRIKKFMLLPKPDEVHNLIVLGLDPPLRQGQTRYPFLVMQFKRDEEVSLSINMTEEQLEGPYKGKLLPHYDAPLSSVVAQVFRGLSGKKVTSPAKDFSSHHAAAGVKCSIKANEGLLFCLEKAFMFVPKPATYIPFDNVALITMSRVGGAMAASRTFDITISQRHGPDTQFSNINREEQTPLENFFRTRNMKTKNEMVDDSSALLAAALNDEDMQSSDEEAVVNRGSADEDDESVDEDFQGDSDSDPAEEYDSNHDSSGSDEEMAEADADQDSGNEEEEEQRPKKKSRKD